MSFTALPKTPNGIEGVTFVSLHHYSCITVYGIMDTYCILGKKGDTYAKYVIPRYLMQSTQWNQYLSKSMNRVNYCGYRLGSLPGYFDGNPFPDVFVDAFFDKNKPCLLTIVSSHTFTVTKCFTTPFAVKHVFTCTIRLAIDAFMHIVREINQVIYLPVCLTKFPLQLHDHCMGTLLLTG